MGNNAAKAYATFEAYDNGEANELRLNDIMDDPIEVVFREGRTKLSNEDDPDTAYRKGLEDMYHYMLSKVVPNDVDEAVVTEANSLKNLVGKSDDEELDLDDARTIGKKISKMKGDDRKKFIGIVNFMGASCRIYNEIWANYKPVDPSKKKSNKGKEFRGDKEIG